MRKKNLFLSKNIRNDLIENFSYVKPPSRGFALFLLRVGPWGYKQLNGAGPP